MRLNRTYTSEEIYELLINYRSNLIAANKLKQEYISTISGGNISQYGLESSMPKAVGQTSDPTFNEISRLIKQDSMIDRLERKVLYIQNRWDRIVEEEQAIVFHLILTGRSFKYISEVTGRETRHVKQTLKNIAKLLEDGELSTDFS